MEVADRSALVRLIRAALVHGIAPVKLYESHLPSGVHTLQIRLLGQSVVVLAAEVAGETATGSYALRLAPLDPSHVPELSAIAGREDEPLPSSGPMSASASAIADGSTPPNFAITLPDAHPEDDVDESDLEASVLFDPEAVLISRAPPRPEGTGPDDTLTIPVRASMMPPGALEPKPPLRPPSGPHTISHLSIPSLPGTPSAAPSTDPARETDPLAPWPPPDSPVAITTEQHPADDEGFSVVFGTEPTTPGHPPSGPGRPVGIVVSHEPAPSLVPTGRFDQTERVDRTQDLVDDEAETYPRDTARFSSSPRTQSGPRTQSPRTQRRTGPVDMVVRGRVIANRYRVESLVGSGAVGAVYKATHVDLPRTFAIKVLHPHFRADPQLLASFRTEAQAASLLDHPNVTVVHDFGEEPDGLVYIVMEFLAGSNLQSVLDEEGRLGPQRAIHIMLQVCGALSAAHERGIIHRDVKPDNIMLVPSRDDEGRAFEMVKVCDFGIAALETALDAANPEWTAGTPEYMAPEQAQGRADARTDVYACGIVLYEMLTGRPPFVGDSPLATLAKQVNELARRPSEVWPGFPLALEAVILRAIEKSPDHRFATMRDLRIELKRLL